VADEHWIVWFRNDLRLHDPRPLVEAASHAAHVTLVYCFDPRQLTPTSAGTPRLGAHRGLFLLQSLHALRDSLRRLGNELLVHTGWPEVVIPTLAQQLGASVVSFHREATSEEVAVEDALQKALRATAVRCAAHWGHTIYDPNHLPFAVSETPEVFTSFRTAVEKQTKTAEPLPAPAWLPPPKTTSEPSTMVSLCDLGLRLPPTDARTNRHFVGGEAAGLEQLDDFLWRSDRVLHYRETRNGMLRPQDSSMLSPWLAHGCLSPRHVLTELRRYEAQQGDNESTLSFFLELLWRDYFRWIAKKHGARLFQLSGLRGLRLPWKCNAEPFDRWRQGRTGYPIIDACMQELAVTGFLSNRGRQIVASFLTKNLGIDWRWGASWFESTLIDYDPCSNWGNWNYAAGVGNDPRGFRYFNVLKQSSDYDPNGTYVRHWLPVLQALPEDDIHEPWMLTPIEQTRYGVHIGSDYPAPMVSLDSSVEEQRRIYEQALDLWRRTKAAKKQSVKGRAIY